MADFGTLNWSILVVYILGNLLLGALLSKKVKSADDFFLSDRSIPWWAIGISVVSTYVSALTFLGGPAWSYSEGMSVIAIHLNYQLVIFFVITFFLPFFYNSGVASIYDYQEKRFGPASRSVLASVFLISQALTSAAVLYATSLVLEFITGFPVQYCIVVVTVVALIYTSLGGIAAVIWTDVVQAGILLLGALIILFALLGELPAPLREVLSDLKAEGRTRALIPDFDFTRATTVWSGVFAMTLFHVTVYGANQMMVQRTLAAKNIGEAKKSFLMMGFGAFFIYFLFVFLGILFYAYYGGREFDNGNTIILQFAADYGLPGLMGIVAAAVVAASMSSLDSAFNSMATVSTVDFYQRYYRPDASGQHYLRVSRAFTVIWALCIIVPALLFAGSEGSILETLSNVFARVLFSRHHRARFAGGGAGRFYRGLVRGHADRYRLAVVLCDWRRGQHERVAAGQPADRRPPIRLVALLGARSARGFCGRGARRSRGRLVYPAGPGGPRVLVAAGVFCLLSDFSLPLPRADLSAP